MGEFKKGLYLFRVGCLIIIIEKPGVAKARLKKDFAAFKRIEFQGPGKRVISCIQGFLFKIIRIGEAVTDIGA